MMVLGQHFLVLKKVKVRFCTRLRYTTILSEDLEGLRRRVMCQDEPPRCAGGRGRGRGRATALLLNFNLSKKICRKIVSKYIIWCATPFWENVRAKLKF